MVWTKKATSVTCRQLRLNTVEEAVPDILISELECLVRLHHPRILMLMAICQEDNFDSLSLVFAKVGIGSLYFFLHQQNLRLKHTFAAAIIIQISEALDFVHGSGFIHCGISSHAIMLMEENQAKLACFEYTIPEKESASLYSSSNRHPWLSADSHISCLRHWIAPEVLLSTSKPTQASDVYSLCSVMWELVIGDVPFGDCDLINLRRLLTTNAELQLPLPKDVIPPIWHRIMQVGLKRKCDERDLDITEIRYMMKLCKERLLSPSGANTSAAATSTATGEKKTGRGTSIRSLTAAAAAAANNTGPFKVLQSTLTRHEPTESDVQDGGKVVSLFRNCSIVSSIAKVQNTSFGSHDVN